MGFCFGGEVGRRKGDGRGGPAAKWVAAEVCCRMEGGKCHPGLCARVKIERESWAFISAYATGSERH